MTENPDANPSGRRDPSAGGELVEGVSVLRRTPVETDGLITIETSDATAWCPYEGTADYYTLRLEYCPEEYAVELMSFRDYLQTFRDEEIGHEEYVERVYEDLRTVLEPEWLRLVGDAPPRYGLDVTIRHQTEPKPAALQDDAGTKVTTDTGGR
jgi:7-cyano-7-deazaguanine reductase